MRHGFKPRKPLYPPGILARSNHAAPSHQPPAFNTFAQLHASHWLPLLHGTTVTPVALQNNPSGIGSSGPPSFWTSIRAQPSQYLRDALPGLVQDAVAATMLKCHLPESLEYPHTFHIYIDMEMEQRVPPGRLSRAVRALSLIVATTSSCTRSTPLCAKRPEPHTECIPSAACALLAATLSSHESGEEGEWAPLSGEELG